MKILIAILIVLNSNILFAADAETPATCEALLFDNQLWLEEIEGEKALAWVREQNELAFAALKDDPEYAAILADVKSVVLAKDRVPLSVEDRGYYHDFWQDEAHPRGILRRTTRAEYLSDSPNWETVLDIDALAEKENQNWNYQYSVFMTPVSQRSLVKLSVGGGDAVVMREFDYDRLQFVPDGFNVSVPSKMLTAAIDENTLLIATDFGAGTATKSGYPRVLKRWTRGQKLSDAVEIFRGAEEDFRVNPWVFSYPTEKYVLIFQQVTFVDTLNHYLEADGSLRVLPLPLSSELLTLRKGQVYFELREDLVTTTQTFKAGSILRIELSDRDLEKSVLVWAPSKGQSKEHLIVEKDRIVITVLDNIKSKMLELKATGPATYSERVMDVPTGGTIVYSAPFEGDPTSYASFKYEDQLTPRSQYRIYSENGVDRYERIKSSQARFDATPYESVQMFATSKDGTQIPYFIMKRKDLVLDGSHPTILYGYGGFEISLTPDYMGMTGKAWLDRGGVHVMANIRGGAEYGPEWHQAALRENRQRAYDDFAAVAEDLIARKITSPKHLGIEGSSNGGLLAGVLMTQRPELFNAVVIGAPLLDMIRYTKLLAGDSWKSEYGDPDVPADREFILKYSPYQNLRKGQVYPRPFITTSTKDDRVHPGHARKFAARMIEQGHPVLFFENTDGGHSGSTGPESRAELEALGFAYFWRQLSAP